MARKSRTHGGFGQYNKEPGKYSITRRMQTEASFFECYDQEGTAKNQQDHITMMKSMYHIL
ncbi:hypothetical protein ACJMK2_000152, partial [Sinanodonta woodiana]